MNSILNQELAEELKQYHELEEELGCPLKVLMQALEDGEIKTKEKTVGFMTLEKDDDYILNTALFKDNGEFEKIVVLYLKDYKKTWWLKTDQISKIK